MGRKSREKRERREAKRSAQEFDSDIVLKHPTLQDVYKVASASTGMYVSLELPGWSMERIHREGPALAAKLEKENWQLLERARELNMRME